MLEVSVELRGMSRPIDLSVLAVVLEFLQRFLFGIYETLKNIVYILETIHRTS